MTAARAAPETERVTFADMRQTAQSEVERLDFWLGTGSRSEALARQRLRFAKMVELIDLIMSDVKLLDRIKQVSGERQKLARDQAAAATAAVQES